MDNLKKAFVLITQVFLFTVDNLKKAFVLITQ